MGGLVPFQGVEFGFEAALWQLGEMIQEHEIEIPPGQFGQPGGGPRGALAPGLGGQVAQG